MKKVRKNIKGQSLLELVIALTLLIVIVTLVTLATANGLKNSQFSKNQIQATKLAQEGIERVRSIRDRNYTVCGRPGNSSQVNFSSMWTQQCPVSPPGQCIYVFNNSNSCLGTVITDPFWLNYPANPATTEQLTVNGFNFQRQLLMIDSGSVNAKEVRVTVSWKDTSGTHKSDLSTILSNY
jgi:type II secretory pathway component PulJ